MAGFLVHPQFLKSTLFPYEVFILNKQHYDNVISGELVFVLDLTSVRNQVGIFFFSTVVKCALSLLF